MPLSGQAKVDYQREYMRKVRSNLKILDPIRPVKVEPTPFPVRDFVDDRRRVDAKVIRVAQKFMNEGTHIADPTGGAVIDTEARTAINAILVRLEEKDINATS